jgi:hypothetical protein
MEDTGYVMLMKNEGREDIIAQEFTFPLLKTKLPSTALNDKYFVTSV